MGTYPLLRTGLQRTGLPVLNKFQNSSIAKHLRVNYYSVTVRVNIPAQTDVVNGDSNLNQKIQSINKILKNCLYRL